MRGRLHGQATERDVETEVEACDLADELEEAPGMVEWPETLAVLREVAPDAVAALVTLPGPRWKPPGTGRRSRSR